MPTIGTTEFRVRYAETDRMGVVYHANYFVWFEVGRNEYFRQAGLIYRKLEDEGIVFPLTACDAVFKKGALYDDLVTIETWVQAINGPRVVLGYRALRDNETLVTGTTTHAFAMKDKGPCNMKKLRPGVWDVFEKLYLGNGRFEVKE